MAVGIRWALHVTGVDPKKLRAALEKERDHYLETSPIPSADLDQINAGLRASYNGPAEVTVALREARKRHLAEKPHPDTPRMVEQMNAVIDAACRMAEGHDGEVFASVYGSLAAKIGEATEETDAAYGDRVTISLDMPRVRRHEAPARLVSTPRALP